MRKHALIGWVAVMLLIAAPGLARAEVTVDILSTNPADGTIGESEQATIYWRIESDCSLDYVVEVGGDGTVDSGEQVSASNGSGSFSGTKSSSTTIDAENDFDDEDGDYTIYVIATCSNGDTSYASTMISLDTPPDQVTGLSVGRGDGKLFLTWETVETEDIDYYLVYYGTSPGSSTGTEYDGADAEDGVSPIDVGDVDDYQLSGLSNNVTYYVRVSAVDDSGSEGPLSEEGSGSPTDTVGYSELANDEGGECFIATAAWGDYNNPMVLNLRHFRDGILAHSTGGRALVEFYYRTSPPLAHWLAGHRTARAAVRLALTPISWGAACETTYPGSISLVLTGGLTALLLFRIHRRRREVKR